jgi:hypothetical protein
MLTVEVLTAGISAVTAVGHRHFCAFALWGRQLWRAGVRHFEEAPMAAEKDHATEGRPLERRHRRSACLADALRLQLDACREDEGLAAIVVSDDLGLCVAHSGGDGIHEELAAQLPMLADGCAAPSPLPPAALAMATFSVSGATLHACTVAAPGSDAGGARNDDEVLTRVASGFTRLLTG